MPHRIGFTSQGVVVAENSRRGSRSGAITGRTQVQNGATGLWTKRNSTSGRFTEIKKTSGKFKGVRRET